MKKLFAASVLAVLIGGLAPAVAVNAPSNVAVSNAANLAGQARVTWDAVTGAVGYRVKVSSDLGDSITAVANGTELQLKNLVGGKSYQISVGTSDTSTWSAYSSAVTFVGEDKPGAPSNGEATTGVGSVTLTWVAPTSTPSITTYSIVSSAGNDTRTVTDANATSYTVSGLTAGAQYTFTLYANNRIGSSTGLAFPTVTVPTVPGTPGTPTAEYSSSNGAITATWTAPTSNGGADITSYTAVLSPTGGSDSETVVTGLSATFTSIAAGTYTVKVKATNGVGSGALSSASAQVVVSATKSAQTISFTDTPTSTATVGGTDSVAASASSNLAVSFSVSPSSVCSIASTTISYTGAGTCRITATQEGDNSFLAASEFVDVTVSAATPTPTPSPTSTSSSGTGGGSSGGGAVATPTATPTPTATATPQPTVTPQPTTTATPQPTATATPQPTAKPLVGGLASLAPGVNADPTPGSPPAGTVKLSLVPASKVTVTASSSKPVQLSMPKLPARQPATVRITTPSGKSVALPAVKTDAKGNLVLSALKLTVKGTYSLKVSVKGTVRTVTIRVNR